MQYPGMKERVERELLAMRPFQSHFKVQESIILFKTLFIMTHSIRLKYSFSIVHKISKHCEKCTSLCNSSCFEP